MGRGDIRQRLLDHINGDNPCITRNAPTHWVDEVTSNAEAREKDDLVANIAHQVFITHAAPGSKTEAFARKVAASGKPLLILYSPANTDLVEMGADTSPQGFTTQRLKENRL